jgi:hypothetical protein
MEPKCSLPHSQEPTPCHMAQNFTPQQQRCENLKSRVCTKLFIQNTDQHSLVQIYNCVKKTNRVQTWYHTLSDSVGVPVQVFSGG